MECQFLNGRISAINQHEENVFGKHTVLVTTGKVRTDLLSELPTLTGHITKLITVAMFPALGSEWQVWILQFHSPVVDKTHPAAGTDKRGFTYRYDHSVLRNDPNSVISCSKSIFIIDFTAQ